MTSSFTRPLASATLTIALCAGCNLIPALPDPLELPEAKARNLEELHGPDGEYRYAGSLLGDFGYLIESLTGKDRTILGKVAGIPNPGMATQVNLNGLLGISKSRPGAYDLQLEWCARLVSSDPSVLVRERAALGLGELGHWAGLRTLGPPPSGAPATPDEVGEAIEAILKSLRLARDGQGEEGGVSTACESAQSLHLDLNGGWIMLSFVSQSKSLANSPEESAHIDSLITHLRVVVIQDGVYRALNDSSDFVRIAGLRAMAMMMGSRALAGSLSKPLPGWSDTVILGLVDLVSDYGLPADGVSETLTAACLHSLIGWATDHPSPRVRTRSMLALQAVAPSGPSSLREEDWHRWSKKHRDRFGPSS